VNHALRLPKSKKYLVTDKNLIPTGELKSVKGSDLNFGEFTDIKEVLDKHIDGASFKGLDHAFTIENKTNSDKVKLAAELRYNNT